MDNIILGLKIMVIGFTVVIVTLLLLYFILRIFSKLCSSTFEKAVTAPVTVTHETAGIHTENTSEFIAVISAAIAAAMHMPPSQFSVTAVTPVNTRNYSGWVHTGRKNLLNKSHDLAMRRRER